MMKTITKEALEQVLDKHQKWLDCEEGGERADLSGTDLSGSNLRLADIRYADLRYADLRYADFTDANLTDADLTDADLTGTHFGDNIPIIQDIHKKVYEAASQEGALYMGAWHSCDTTHCRAGWVVHLAGEEGYALQEELGPDIAAAAIYEASDPGFTGREGVPDFYANKKDTMADMERMAECA